MARHPVRDIKDVYEIGSKVTPNSAGGSGEVVICTRKEDGKHFALKKVAKHKDCLEGMGQVKAMMHVDHAHVIKLIEWFEDEEMIFIVMELARGGDMCDKILNEKQLSEKHSALAFWQLLKAANHIHNKGIVHADIKPENVLYIDGENIDVKLGDFGFAQFIGEGTLIHCGTKLYSAPEIREERQFDTMADMWSLGILLYTMLAGGPPFSNPSLSPDGRVKINFNHRFQSVSSSAIDLIQRLLMYNPRQRLSAAEALRHRWFSEQIPESMRHLQEHVDSDHNDNRWDEKEEAHQRRQAAVRIAEETLQKIYDRFIE